MDEKTDCLPLICSERVPLDEFSHWRAIFPTIGNDEYQNHGDEDEEEDLAVGEH
jgi:hypothetical protein